MAGNTELFDEFADISALERQKTAILSSLKEIKDAIGSLGKIEISAKSANVNFSQTVKNYKELEKAQQDAKKAADSLAVAQAKLATEQARLSKEQAKYSKEVQNATKAEAQAREANAKAAVAEARAREQAQKEQAKESAGQREALRAYKSLQREYVILRKVAEDYGASLGTNSVQYREAAARANELNNKLKAIDAGIGNFQRNVGNYASGFGGLSNSINQITRELPAFTNSFQTGFLAISNNLPIFFDEIGRVRSEITRLREAGEQTPSLLQALGKSFFSLGTALSLGVTLLTVFGGALVTAVAGLFNKASAAEKAANALDVFTKAQDKATEALDSFNEAIKRDSGGLRRTLNNQLAFSQALGKSDEERLKIRKELAKLDALEAQRRFNETEGELELERRRKAYEEATDALREFQKLAGNETGIFGGESLDGKKFGETEEFRKREQQLQTQVASTEKAYNKQEKIVEDYYNANRDLTIADLELQQYASEQRVKILEKSLFRAPLEDLQKQFEDASQIEDAYFKQRIEFRQQAAAIEQKLIRDQQEVEVFNARIALDEVLGDIKASNVDKINAQNEYNNKVREINQAANYEVIRSNRRLNEDIIKIKADGYKKQKELDDAATKDFIEQTKKRQEENARAAAALQGFDESKIQNNLQQELTNLDSQFAKVDRRRKDFSQKEREYQIRRLQLQEEYQIKLLESQIAFAEKQLKIDKEIALSAGDQESLDRIRQAEENLYGLRIKLKQAYASKSIKLDEAIENSNKKALDEQIKGFQKVRDIGLQAASILADAASIGAENEKNRIQEQIDLIEKRKAAEIAAINATTLSEEEKANKIKILEANAAAQREQLEIRQRKLEERRARFQKAISIATIIASTAEAVMAALGSKPYMPANLAQAAIIGALGAARAAVVAATPIPKYKHGTDDHPGGLAIVGDGGKKEVVMAPDGSVSITPNRPTIMDLPKGTIVHPDAEAFMRQANGPIARDGMVNDNIMAAMMKANVDAIGRVEAAINNKQENYFYPGKFKTRNGQNWTTYVNWRIFE